MSKNQVKKYHTFSGMVFFIFLIGNYTLIFNTNLLRFEG